MTSKIVYLFLFLFFSNKERVLYIVKANVPKTDERSQ